MPGLGIDGAISTSVGLNAARKGSGMSVNINEHDSRLSRHASRSREENEHNECEQDEFTIKTYVLSNHTNLTWSGGGCGGSLRSWRKGSSPLRRLFFGGGGVTQPNLE